MDVEEQRRQVHEMTLSRKQLQESVADLQEQLDAESQARNEEAGKWVSHGNSNDIMTEAVRCQTTTAAAPPRARNLRGKLQLYARRYVRLWHGLDHYSPSLRRSCSGCRKFQGEG
jgi:hypothetical protein